MQCLRCGYCCKNMAVAIVDDPDLDPVEGNIVFHAGGGKHLRGDGPGKYLCAVHDKPWYPETPCFGHRQFEFADSPCRMGQHILGIRKGKEQGIEMPRTLLDKVRATRSPDEMLEIMREHVQGELMSVQGAMQANVNGREEDEEEDERRVYDHTTLYVPETDEAHDLPLGVIKVVAAAESPEKKLIDLEGEVADAGAIGSDRVKFVVWAHVAEFEDGTRWPDSRGLVVEAKWEKPARLGYDALVIERVVDAASGCAIIG
jgi:hypothetical protein